MAKKTETTSENEAFEMIELAIGDLELLTRAFNVINEACAEIQNPHANTETPPRIMIN